jgi:hypothetical protein
MKPTKGRIVIYHCDEKQKNELNNHQKDAPAIITAAWSDECVNLKVLFDGELNLWVTSATLGNNERQWQWPEIVNADAAEKDSNVSEGE